MRLYQKTQFFGKTRFLGTRLFLGIFTISQMSSTEENVPSLVSQEDGSESTETEPELPAVTWKIVGIEMNAEIFKDLGRATAWLLKRSDLESVTQHKDFKLKVGTRTMFLSDDNRKGFVYYKDLWRYSNYYLKRLGRHVIIIVAISKATYGVDNIPEPLPEDLKKKTIEEEKKRVKEEQKEARRRQAEERKTIKRKLKEEEKARKLRDNPPKKRRKTEKPYSGGNLKDFVSLILPLEVLPF